MDSELRGGGLAAGHKRVEADATRGSSSTAVVGKTRTHWLSRCFAVDCAFPARSLALFVPVEITVTARNRSGKKSHGLLDHYVYDIVIEMQKCNWIIRFSKVCNSGMREFW